MLKVRELKADEVTFELEIHEEDHKPDFNTGDEEADRETLREVNRRLRKGDLWAWCMVEVTARWNDRTGFTTLGACSYKDEADFKADEGYYQQMCDDALVDLNRSLQSTFKDLEPLLER